MKVLEAGCATCGLLFTIGLNGMSYVGVGRTAYTGVLTNMKRSCAWPSANYAEIAYRTRHRSVRPCDEMWSNWPFWWVFSPPQFTEGGKSHH